MSLRIAFLVAGLLFLFGTGLAGAGGQAYRVGTLLKIVSQDLSESRAGAPQPPVDEGGGGAQEHNGVVWWITIRSAPFVYFSKVVVDAGAPAWLGSFRSCERVRFRVSGQKLFLARLNGTEVEARLVSVGRAAPGRLCSRRR